MFRGLRIEQQDTTFRVVKKFTESKGNPKTLCFALQPANALSDPVRDALVNGQWRLDIKVPNSLHNTGGA